jgi:hypothetical protein
MADQMQNILTSMQFLGTEMSMNGVAKDKKLTLQSTISLSFLEQE